MSCEMIANCFIFSDTLPLSERDWGSRVLVSAFDTFNDGVQNFCTLKRTKAKGKAEWMLNVSVRFF